MKDDMLVPGNEVDEPPGPGHMKEDALEPGDKEENALGTGQQGGGRVEAMRQGEQCTGLER